MSVPIGYPTADEFAVGSGPTAADTFPVQRADYTTLPATASRFAILHDLPGRPASDFAPGLLDREGVQDATNYLIDCWATNALAGVPTAVGDGLYRCNGRLMLTNGVQIVASRKATFARYHNNSTQSWVSHTGFGGQSPLRDVSIQGGRWWNTDPDAINGNMFDLYLEDSEMVGMFVDEWGNNARLALIAGNRNRIVRNVGISARDGGGWRLEAAQENLLSQNYTTCGDDCYILTVGQNPANWRSGIDTARNQIIDNIAYSWNARLAVVTMIGDGTPIIAASLLDNAIIGLRGRGRRVFEADNTISSGRILGLDLVDIVGDCTDATTGGASAFIIGSHVNCGMTDDVNVVRAKVRGPFQSAFEVKGTARAKVSQSYFGAPRTASQVVARLDGATAQMDFDDTTFEGRSDAHVVRVGFSGGTGRFRFSKCRFLGVGDSQQGMRVYNSARVTVDESEFAEAAGATSAGAIRADATALGVEIGKNNYAGITPATKLTWLVPSDTGSTIRAATVQRVSAARTLGLHESGAELLATGAAPVPITLPPAAPGLRFAGVQQGDGTLRFIAASGDTIRLGRDASSAAGLWESVHRGASVDLVCEDADEWIARAFTASGWRRDDAGAVPWIDLALADSGMPIGQLGFAAGGPFTVLVRATLTALGTGSEQTIAQVDDNSLANRFFVRQNASGSNTGVGRRTASGTVSASALGTITAGVAFNMGFSVDGAGGVLGVVNAGTAVSVTDGPTGGLTRIRLMTNSDNSLPAGGTLHTARVRALALNAAALEAAVAALT